MGDSGNNDFAPGLGENLQRFGQGLLDLGRQAIQTTSAPLGVFTEQAGETVQRNVDRLTGRDLQVEQIEMTRQRIAEEAQMRQQLLEEEREATRQRAVQASAAAGSTRRRPATRVTRSANTLVAPTAINQNVDFLGL